MSSKKTLALALCVAITGCAQTPKNDADGSNWWPFGSSDKVAANEPAPAPAPLKTAATAPVAKSESSSPWYWPFGSDDEAAKADMKAEVAPEAKKPVAVAKADADTGSKWWWPFGGKDQPTTKAVPMPDPKVTQAWLDDYEPRLREAVKDSNLQLERRMELYRQVASTRASFCARGSIKTYGPRVFVTNPKATSCSGSAKPMEPPAPGWPNARGPRP